MPWYVPRTLCETLVLGRRFLNLRGPLPCKHTRFLLSRRVVSYIFPEWFLIFALSWGSRLAGGGFFIRGLRCMPIPMPTPTPISTPVRSICLWQFLASKKFAIFIFARRLNFAFSKPALFGATCAKTGKFAGIYRQFNRALLCIVLCILFSFFLFSLTCQRIPNY